MGSYILLGFEEAGEEYSYNQSLPRFKIYYTSTVVLGAH